MAAFLKQCPWCPYRRERGRGVALFADGGLDSLKLLHLLFTCAAVFAGKRVQKGPFKADFFTDFWHPCSLWHPSGLWWPSTSLTKVLGSVQGHGAKVQH